MLTSSTAPAIRPVAAAPSPDSPLRPEPQSTAAIPATATAPQLQAPHTAQAWASAAIPSASKQSTHYYASGRFGSAAPAPASSPQARPQHLPERSPPAPAHHHRDNSRPTRRS